MNYFQPYSFPADQTVLAAWDSQLAELADCPALVNALAKQRELFPRFAAHYARLRALPRGTRRALQRKLAEAREFVSLQPEWQKKLAGSLAGAALLLALAQSANAATITVTTNIPDINDGDGKCSFIEAIINANNDAATHPDCAAGDGANTIVLPNESTIRLTHYYGAFLGMPILTGALTIEGNDASIQGGAAIDVIIVASSGDVTLRNLTLRDGIIGAGNFGRLTIENSSIFGNGFALNRYTSGHGVVNWGTLIVSKSSIVSNKTHGSADPPFISVGGGILNNGGGVANILESTISNNSANGGGGIANFGTLIIQNSTVSGNAVYGIAMRFSRVAGGFGGGIENGANSYLRIENSTISGNTAEATGGGIHSAGSVVIENSTITDNRVVSSVGLDSFGGGVRSSGGLTLSGSLISGNAATLGPEVYASGVIATDDLNLLGVDGASGVHGFTPGPTDIVPAAGIIIDKILGPLQDNGGPTLTHALVKGSPALDAAPVDANCPVTDQRGVGRPQGTACDIGGVEEQPPPPPPPQPTGHNFVVTSVKAPQTIKHGGGTAPVAVTIRNASTHNETLSSSSVLGDGATTGLVRLDVAVIDTDGEQCEPAAVALNGAKNAKLFSKGAKVLSTGASLAVNFLVTYRCDAPQPLNKRNPEPGDYKNSASVFPDELDGMSDSNASSTLPGVATKVTR